MREPVPTVDCQKRWRIANWRGASCQQDGAWFGSDVGFWLGHRHHAHPGIDRFAAQTRILHILALYLARYWPLGRDIRDWHRRPEQVRAYGYLRAELTWLGAPAGNWQIIDDLVQILLDVIGGRADPYTALAPST